MIGQNEGRMKWLIGVVSLTGGVVWLLAGLVSGEGLDIVYVAIGLVMLLGGAAWLLSLRASSKNSGRPSDHGAE